ncbi:hypothetical protein WOLCODRAFT_149495 [Wolfiporia cocos MD-104 SS10]|uniref:RanBP2-type domain-containing protein n=1 Tax=Wolfiporia cocos (strain MD-104) TaxID=742152 RepID=A0A2H3JLF9_WOLCO|nr:hypothetical protein WOLCODRAFT_149495 [Wolfiporia cocos MD-104 SS10]
MVPVSTEEHSANAHAPAKAHLVCQEHPLTPVHAPATLTCDAVTSCTSTSGQQHEQETVMNSKALERAASVLLEALPRYKFSVCVAPSPGAGSRFMKAWQFASSVPVHTLPAYNFMKHVASFLSTSAVSLSKQPEWICGLCQLWSPDSAVKCIVCEAPRPRGPSQASPSPASSSPSSAPSAPEPAPSAPEPTPSALEPASSAPSPTPSAPSPPLPVSGFNWAAAGLAPPSATSDWECSICMVWNKSTGEDQQQRRKSGWLEKSRSTWAPVLGGEEEQPPTVRRDVRLYGEEAQAEGRAQEKQRMAVNSRKASKTAAGTVAYDDGSAGLGIRDAGIKTGS